MKYHILYIITNYKIGDGSSNAVYNQLKCDEDITEDYLIVCKSHGDVQNNLKITQDTDILSIKSFLNHENLIIHYFKASNSNVLKQVLANSDKRIPILTTVCQSPSYKRMIITPFEFKVTNHFVFIDKSSFHNNLINFLPDDCKSLIYLTMGKYDEITASVPFPDNSPDIVFGRGTTLAKCPKDMFEIFDRINIPNKKFVIVGIPEGDNWVRLEASKRNNVIVYEVLPFEEWFNICQKFDIFLYQIPFDCYASLDGNLGLAMLMRKPVVYMGSNGPKERFVSGENGYIANTPEEMITFAESLAKDAELRHKIGEKARESVLSHSKKNNRKSSYYTLYQNLYKSIPYKRIPFRYYIIYMRRCYKDIIKDIFNWYK